MNTNAISAASPNASSLSTSNTNGKTDSNMFMTLLVAQLKNQDPLQPQDGTAFVAQLAQFNSLDQLIGIRQSMERLVASIYQTPPTTSPSPAPAPNPNSNSDNQ